MRDSVSRRRLSGTFGYQPTVSQSPAVRADRIGLRASDRLSVRPALGRIIPKLPSKAVGEIKAGSSATFRRPETSMTGVDRAPDKRIDSLLDSETAFTAGVIVIGMMPVAIIAIVLFSR